MGAVYAMFDALLWYTGTVSLLGYLGIVAFLLFFIVLHWYIKHLSIETSCLFFGILDSV